VLPIVQNVLSLVGMFYIAMRINSRLALLSLTVVPFVYYSIGYYTTHIQKRLRTVKGMEGETLGIIHEAISMLRVIVAFGREDHEHARFMTQSTTGFAARLRAALEENCYGLLVGLLTAPLAGVRLQVIAQLGVGLVIAAILAVLVGLLWGPTRERLGALLRRLPYVERHVERLEAGLAELARTPSLVQLILSTCAARLFTAVQYLALFAAVGLPLGFWQAWFALSVRTLLLAIPIQGPAGLGTTQLWWVTALLLLGTSAHTAIAAGLSVHLLDLVVSLSLAALGWVLLALPRSRRRLD